MSQQPLNYHTPPKEDFIARMIPGKNPHALISYYLGLFSLFPCLGFFLAVPAVILGFMGLKRHRLNPEIHGKGHALTGIICGLIFGICNLGCGGMMIVGILARR